MTDKSIPYLIQGDNIILVIDNVINTVSKADINYEKIRLAIKNTEWSSIPELLNVKEMICTYSKGNVTIENGIVYWKEHEMHGALSARMITMLQEGFPVDPLALFMENLMLNPSNRAVTELYGFLEKNNLPITSDGHFLAYKRVRHNYTDVWTGKFDNSVGQTVEMQRNMVNDNKEQTCSTGLHFCSEDYLGHFGGEKIMILKINPADVVSIPVDYNDSKGRCCKYTVVGELGVHPKEAFTKPVQENSSDNLHIDGDVDLDDYSYDM